MNDQKRLVDRNHMATHAYVVPGYTKDSGQRLRQPEVKKTRRGNVTTSYGKFKVNHPIVGLSLINTTGIFSDLYITCYTRLSILYDSASPLSYLCSQNGTNPISVSITSYNCLSQILKQRLFGV